MPSAILAAHRTRRPLFWPLRLFAKALELHRQRARLAHLDDHLLRDIGLSPDDALAEAQRPLWDVPTHWRG